MASRTFESLSAGHVSEAVRARYSAGAEAVQPALCCPVEYDQRWLAVLPQELLDKDYGCGDPSRHVREGETVLDLGSGAGKMCYIASQVVGPRGRVIGVDMTSEMLALARKHQAAIAERIGWSNVEFHRGRIEDLELDLDRLESWLAAHPVDSLACYEAMQRECARLRREEPLIAEASVDVVVSNCVLNLVAPEAKRRLFDEIFRVLRKGGRAVISDIVADRPVPEELQRDPELWSGCVSGALEEGAFLKAFEEAGFHGVQVLARQSEPWRELGGLEFRSLTVAAWKGKQGPCIDEDQSVIYKGPFRTVCDDDNHVFRRGERVPVCAKTFALLGQQPYAGSFTRLQEDGITERDAGALCGGEEPCC